MAMIMNELSTVDGYAQVGMVLNALNTSSTLSPGLKGYLFTAIDNLRDASAHSDKLDIAERISLVALQLDWAVLKRDADKENAARLALSELSDLWHSKPGTLLLHDAVRLDDPFESDLEDSVLQRFMGRKN
jgi:hypothetical protein